MSDRVADDVPEDMASGAKTAAHQEHATPRPAWTDRLWRLRDQLFGSPAFQRWAADFPFTRLVARQQSRAAFDLCAGFVYSQVLLACVQLNVLHILADEPLGLDAIAGRIGLTPSATLRLLSAAVSLKLVARRSGGRYGLGATGAAIRHNRAITDMIVHHQIVYRDLSDPVALLQGKVRQTGLAQYWAYARNSDAASIERDTAAAYTQLMSSSLDLIAGDIFDAYPLDKHHAALDVGGGDGSFALAAAQRYPRLSATTLDIPAVAAIASARFAAAGMTARCQAFGADMFSGPLPSGFDLVTLVRVLLDHDDAAALALLRRARSALLPGGTLLIAEPQADIRGAEAMGAAYFGFYLLAMGQGRARSFHEISGLLHQAGFKGVARLPTRRPLFVSVVTARAVSASVDDNRN